ncbi:hypothetical protein [Halarcobacter sp.]|uniref:hypothetical protein n=1 Tax=Halarcobacter sp. TaxID=2321133 RepID=UPI003AFF64FB
MNYKLHKKLVEESKKVHLWMNDKEFLELQKKFDLRYLEIKANVKLIKEIQIQTHYFISSSNLVAKQQEKKDRDIVAKQQEVDLIDNSINKMNREINKFNKNNRYKNKHIERGI